MIEIGKGKEDDPDQEIKTVTGVNERERKGNVTEIVETGIGIAVTDWNTLKLTMAVKLESKKNLLMVSSLIMLYLNYKCLYITWITNGCKIKVRVISYGH